MFLKHDLKWCKGYITDVENAIECDDGLVEDIYQLLNERTSIFRASWGCPLLQVQ